MNKRILMVLTSHDRLGDTGEPTGFWLEELAAPYYVCLDAGAEVVLASPKGGKPPLDPKSDAEDSQTEATRRFQQDSHAQQALANTHKLSEVSADDFDAVFYPGGHGPLWDLVEDKDSIRLIEAFWAQQKPVAAVCHAPIVLLHARDEEGNPIIRGRQVTGFTNEEEEAVGLTQVVPHLVENALKEGGAHYSKADVFASYTRQDGRLITGQNPPSSEPTAKLLLEALVK
ncbi:MAG: type 1 glutamine amidotransferase domain-containing protein [Halomonas sp.]|nr:type 1 glutamine amidotransferase domain-containing protein [Halomonas sp.]MDX5504022.1 type 1 glutamine amidotransferase domain-containing protein [Halomonas sp.]